MRHQSDNPLLEVSPYASDGGQLIGRDPREIPAEDYVDRLFLFGLDVIRAKCLDCAIDPKEVRKCVQTSCALWDFRMGCVPKAYRKAAMRAKMSANRSGATTLAEQSEAEQNPEDEAENDAEQAI